MLRIRIAKELLLAVAISLICHLLYFVVIKFDFPSISNRFREPNISFLGELLDKSDFPSLIEGELGKSAAFDLKEIVFSAGQAKNHGILYNRVRLVSLEKQIYLPQKNRYFFERIEFADRKKPLFGYSGINAKNIPFFPIIEKGDIEKEQNTLITFEKLKDPFFYKELSKFAAMEAELKVVPRMNILLIKRVRSSGDLEIDLFILRVMRRKLYLSNRQEGLLFKKVRASFSDD